jgi:hypothetical protein
MRFQEGDPILGDERLVTEALRMTMWRMALRSA